MRRRAEASRRPVQVFVWGVWLMLGLVLLAGAGCAHHGGGAGGTGVDVQVRGQWDFGMERSGSHH